MEGRLTLHTYDLVDWQALKATLANEASDKGRTAEQLERVVGRRLVAAKPA